MKMLNLGCGTKASSSPNVVNIDWSIHLRMKKGALRFVAPLLLKGERLKYFRSLPDNILVHNLAKGIPYGNDSVDVVYHSHMLEHIDRDIAKSLLLEVKRVLKPGGIHRIVVPDLEQVARSYLSHISTCENDPGEKSEHDTYVAAILEQCVRKEASGTSRQRPVRRFIENALLGDARRRGETHQWMYDKVNLSALLVSLGYKNLQHQSYDRSMIDDWSRYGLDLNEHGKEYKPGSLYIEAQK